MRVARDLLSSRGGPVLHVPDLCGAVARKDPALIEFLNAGRLLVLACRPRAVRNLLATLSGPDPKDWCLVDMKEQGAATKVERLLPDGQPTTVQRCDRISDWAPWFPILDEARCRQCRKCMEFCLFGVYELSSQGRVKVQRPESCKTGCPACARLCPEQAIVFPKCQEVPIDGSEIQGMGRPESGRGAPPQDLRQKLRGRYGPREKGLLKRNLIDAEFGDQT